MRLLIIGPPGSGKGTQALHIARRLAVPAISTGDIFRANVAAETPMGRIAREYMEAGEYVPDQVTNTMVRDRLSESDCASGFLLDGYPRTLQQVAELETVLAPSDSALDAVIELAVDQDVLIERLLLRARSQGRADDTAEVISRRQELYTAQTAPLTRHYADLGLLHLVDGNGSVEDVAARIALTLDQLLARTTS
ncbi:adenylate kinase [Nocardioides marmoriginsengisoli]|uniref:Adenylate kinase n=1 Tax=Nocardioides marmoriginsengisoli TaxID=661483 RepID=A0A3N0CCM9_9ACTN|nr:adenylate kinase [Nocardioides marmoriginsengisoli]RNL61059.1 adenylate kinase [Nocardioides marmoriginsengisoli]